MANWFQPVGGSCAHVYVHVHVCVHDFAHVHADVCVYVVVTGTPLTAVFPGPPPGLQLKGFLSRERHGSVTSLSPRRREGRRPRIDSHLYSRLRARVHSRLYSRLRARLFSHLFPRLCSLLYSQLYSISVFTSVLTSVCTSVFKSAFISVFSPVLTSMFTFVCMSPSICLCHKYCTNQRSTCVENKRVRSTSSFFI